MTPRSLMALASIVLLCAQLAHAAGAWMQVTAGSQTLYIQKEQHEALKNGNRGAQRRLYEKPDGKDSGFVLIKKDANVFVVKKGKTESAVTSVTPVEAPAQTKKEQPAAAPPAGQPQGPQLVKPADIVAADPNIPADQKELVIGVMQRLKTENPREYARMVYGGEKSVKAVAQAILSSSKKLPGDAAAVHKNVMAPVGNHGSIVTSTLDDTKAPANPPQLPAEPDTIIGKADEQANDPEKGGSQNTLINLLAGAMQKSDADAVNAELTARFTKFLKEGGFIAEEVLKNEASMKQIDGFVAAWVKSAKPIDRINLYAVMGTENPPAWIKDEPVQKMLKQAPRLPNLKNAMEPWTKAGAQGGPGLLRRASRDEIAAFFSSDSKDQKTGGAAFWAAKILDEHRDWSQIADSIARRKPEDGTPGRLPPGGGGPTQRDPSQGWDFNSLYTRGGVVARVYMNDDNASRMISVKLYEVRDQATGNLTTMLGVWDITDPSNVFGQNFKISDKGESTFPLDDRIKGYPPYTLKFTPTDDGDSIVTLERPGTKEKGGRGLKTSLQELYSKRAEQALQEGALMDVGGRKFIALGQGGHPGGVAFFDQAALRAAGPRDRIAAELFGATTQRENGRDANMPGKQDIGKVNGEDWHLVYNPSLRYWEVAKGPGDKPKEAEKTTGGGDNKGTGGGTGGGDNKGGENKGGTLSEADVLAKEKQYVANGQYERNEKVMAGLSEQYRNLIRVYSWVKKADDGRIAALPLANRHLLVVPANVHKDRFVHAPFVEADADDVERKEGEIRGIGKYLATTSRKWTAYFDLSKPTPGQGGLFEMDTKCMVNMQTGELCVKDLVLLDDAAKMAGLSDADKETIRKRATDLIGARSEYQLRRTLGGEEGKKVMGPVIVWIRDVGTCTIFPNLVTPCDKSGNGPHDKTENAANGPAHAFDKLTIGLWGQGLPDAKDSQRIEPYTLHEIKRDDKSTVALYATDKDTSKAEVWYLLFKITLRDGGDRRSGWIPVFDKDFPSPGLDKLQIKSLVMSTKRDDNADITSTGEVRRWQPASKDKGVYYVVEEKNVKAGKADTKFTNCVGPVLWWGMSESDAQKSCEKNGAP